MIILSGLTTLLTLGFLSQCVVAVPPLLHCDDTSISWGSCESFEVNSTDSNFECAYLAVPMDYRNSSAGITCLAIIKYSATAKKLGSIFFNPGGPGGSGFATIQLHGNVVSQVFQGAYDIVTWNHREAGHTFPRELYIFNYTQEDGALCNNTVDSTESHDVALELYRAEYNDPAPLGFMTARLFDILYPPMTWSDGVNGSLYEFMGLILHASQTYNLTFLGGPKYNVSSVNTAIDDTFLTFHPNMTSYSTVAVAGANEFLITAAWLPMGLVPCMRHLWCVTPFGGW